MENAADTTLSTVNCQSPSFEMVAKTLYGLEDVLAEELKVLGAKDVEIGRRMVSFTGDKELLYKTNFYCRTALRILKPIYHFKANDADIVYREVKKIPWENYMSLKTTFAIDSVINSEDFNHSKFVAYRTKDAIADYFMEKEKARPSVRVSNPDLYINIHISHNDCTISIDSSGESLHKRGYRVEQTEAPLNEVLAAGMILKTGWRGESNFVDPMCGSGTLLIEAAMIARNIAPGVYRKEYAFEKWLDFDRELFDRIYNDDSHEREFNFKCYGSDISPAAIEIAEKNIRSAGLVKYIDLKVIPFQQVNEAPKPGIMVTNPPYGERITPRDLLGLYSMIGERIKHVFTGYKVWILSYKDECFDKIGLRPNEKLKLMNGSLECEYHCYEIFDGTIKDFKKSLNEQGNGRPESRFSNNQDRHSGYSQDRRFSNDHNDQDRRRDNDQDRRPGGFNNNNRNSNNTFNRFGKTDRPERRFAANHRENDEESDFGDDKFRKRPEKMRYEDDDKFFAKKDKFRDKKHDHSSFKKPFKKKGRNDYGDEE